MKDLKSIKEIKKAVDNGKTVYCGNHSYTVIKDKNEEYLIKSSNGYYIGLHGKKGGKFENKLNGELFFTV